MKKIFLLSIVIFLTFSAKAMQVVGKYTNYLGEEYKIAAILKNNELQRVYLGVEAKGSKNAFIVIDGRDLELFKSALELVRDKYLEWTKIATENNVDEMTKEFGIKFPSVGFAWAMSEWWFSFDNIIKMKFIISDNELMSACWIPTVTASDNRYIKETFYFVFANENDFNDLISQLNYQNILEQLLNTKNNEDLFH